MQRITEVFDPKETKTDDLPSNPDDGNYLNLNKKNLKIKYKMELIFQ